MEIYCRAGEAALHAGYLRLQIHTYCFSTTTVVTWTRLKARTLPVLLRSASKCNTLCNQIATNIGSIRSNAMHYFTLIKTSLASWVQGTSYMDIPTVIRNKVSRIKGVSRLFLTKHSLLNKIYVNFKAAITDTYPRIPWEMFAKGSAEYTAKQCSESLLAWIQKSAVVTRSRKWIEYPWSVIGRDGDVHALLRQCCGAEQCGHTQDVTHACILLTRHMWTSRSYFKDTYIAI
jgi:hypothetical protein